MTNLREDIAAYILSRYEHLGRQRRYGIFLAFDYSKSKLEIENGDVTGWRREDKIDVAHQLLRAAEELGNCD